MHCRLKFNFFLNFNTDAIFLTTSKKWCLLKLNTSIRLPLVTYMPKQKPIIYCGKICWLNKTGIMCLVITECLKKVALYQSW